MQGGAASDNEQFKIIISTQSVVTISFTVPVVFILGLGHGRARVPGLGHNHVHRPDRTLPLGLSKDRVQSLVTNGLIYMKSKLENIHEHHRHVLSIIQGLTLGVSPYRFQRRKV